MKEEVRLLGGGWLLHILHRISESSVYHGQGGRAGAEVREVREAGVR